MNSIDLSLSYWNELSGQLITISSLLAGFSIAAIANLIISEVNTKLSRAILLSAILTAAGFLLAIFAMTSIHMITTKGYPFAVSRDSLNASRYVGILGFVIGYPSILVMISLSGWTKSKKLGIATTIIGIVCFILSLMVS